MTSSEPVRLIPTTDEHCREFLGPLPFRIRAFTAMRGAEILGIGGIATMSDGKLAVFLEVSEETARRYPLTLYKAAKATLELARERGITRLYTAEDAERPAAERFLKRFGFEFVGMNESKKIWQWRAVRAVENEA